MPPWTTKDGSNPPPSRPKGKLWPCKSQPGGCACHCHTLVVTRSPKGNPRIWESSEDAMLRDLLASGCTLIDVADRLHIAFKKRRTPMAIRVRATFLGLSTRDGWWTRVDLRDYLGVGMKRLISWEQSGILHPQGNGKWKRYRPDDIEQFVKDQAGVLIDPTRIRDPKLKAMAEVAAVVNRRRMSA